MKGKASAKPGKPLKRKRVGNPWAASEDQLQRRFCTKHELQVEQGRVLQEVSVLHQEHDPVAARVHGCKGVEATFDVVVPWCVPNPSDLFHDRTQVERRTNLQDARTTLRKRFRDVRQHGGGAIRSGQQHRTAAVQVGDDLHGPLELVPG